MARPSRKQAIIDATVELVAQGGAEAATVRAIAERAGMTEGAVYRHFTSKTDLLRHAYARIIRGMIAEKEQVVASDETFQEKVAAWIRVTFAHYDAHRDAFTFVLLTAHTPDTMDPELTSRQGWLFRQLYAEAREQGAVRPMDPAVALCQFTGVMLNVPRFINAGELPGPAMDYLEATTATVFRLFSNEFD